MPPALRSHVAERAADEHWSRAPGRWLSHVPLVLLTVREAPCEVGDVEALERRGRLPEVIRGHRAVLKRPQHEMGVEEVPGGQLAHALRQAAAILTQALPKALASKPSPDV